MTETKFTIIDGGQVAEVGEREGVELAKLAEAAGRPVAVDRDERVAYLGVSAHERAQTLASLEAPDFALPDAAGRMHRLSEHRGKKVLLVTWASW